MDLQQLQFFVEVVRRGSFAAVARDRHLDPSTVSRSVAALEDELGLRLLHRTTRHLAPTEAGQAYLQRVEPLVGELENAHQVAADTAERPRGTLRILAPVSFAQLNVVPLLPELSRRYPDLSFDLRLTDDLLDLVEERIDVAIRLGPLSDSGLIARRLAPMIPRVAASPAYLERRGRPQRPQDLADHDCLLLEMPGFSNRWRFRGPTGEGSIGEETTVDVRGPLLTSNAIALKQCALAGMGILLQSRWILGRELRQGTLVDLFPHHQATAAHFHNNAYILYPTRTYLPLKVRVFVDFLTEKFRDGAPWEGAGLADS